MMAKYPHGDIAWFKEARFGMFIHWGLYSLPARHEWIRHHEEITDEKYQIYFDLFNPDLFEPEKWAKAAKNAGMKYFVVTTKHHEGFCLFDSKYTDYKVTNTPAGRDLLREIIDAFRAEGIRVGLYYSLIDWHHPDFVIDRRNGPYRNLSEEDFRKHNEGRDMRRYAKYMRDQVTELLTNYGKIDIIWFDFSYPDKEHPEDITLGKAHQHWESEELLKTIRALQPHIIIDNRLDLPGSGDIVTPEQYTPGKAMQDKDGNAVAWEGCQTFSGSWGYHRDESTWKSEEQCIKLLVDHVSRDGNLLMNVGPTARGFLDVRAEKGLSYFAKWMKYNSVSIYGCGAAPGLTAPDGCRYTWNPKTNRLYLHIYSWPFRFLELQNLGGKVKYAQLLHDMSEIELDEASEAATSKAPTAAGNISLKLPVQKPDDAVPVVELFLKEPLA
ncbi:MAG: alpha-L-fucosidase [Lentisphaeria bacterium]|nr:alpha-L-fucosidase [Lentisphaeria bacterium]